MLTSPWASAELIPEIESLVAAEPLQERLRAQLMLALYRAGRQADALAVYREEALSCQRTRAGAQPRPTRAGTLDSGTRRCDRPCSGPGGHVWRWSGGDGCERVAPDEHAEITAVSNALRPQRRGPHRLQVVTGSRAVDLVAIPPGVSNIDVFWEQPVVARVLRGLASFSRMAIFDKRGSGMSDRSIGVRASRTEWTTRAR